MNADNIYPIQMGHLLRLRRGPGTYDEAVRRQQLGRRIKATLDAAAGGAMRGEDLTITWIRLPREAVIAFV